jgi:hypothetical protein
MILVFMDYIFLMCIMLYCEQSWWMTPLSIRQRQNGDDFLIQVDAAYEF